MIELTDSQTQAMYKRASDVYEAAQAFVSRERLDVCSLMVLFAESEIRAAIRVERDRLGEIVRLNPVVSTDAALSMEGK